MVKELLADALELSIAERIQLVQYLWDSIAEIPDAVQLTEKQRTELRRRIADYRKNPGASISWEDLKTRIGL